MILLKVSSVQPKINMQYLILAVLEMYLFILRGKKKRLSIRDLVLEILCLKDRQGLDPRDTGRMQKKGKF